MVTRITFIEPKNDHLHIFSRFELPRLGNLLLATIMRDRGFQTESLFMKRGELLARRIDTDLVAISTITSTAAAAYDIADSFRRRGVPVVIGGPHVSFLPDEALEHADFCIAGEAEKSFPQLVEALNRDGRLDDVPGLSWKDKGVTRHNPTGQPVEDLDTLPFPDFSLLRLGARGKLGGPGPGKATIPVQTSRGCPYNCSFCSVTGMFGHRYRHRSTASVVAELAQYDADKCFIFFYDDNFAANPQKTKELLREMIRLDLGLRWSTQVRTDVARDPELLDLMARAGCATLFIGLESVDPAALKEMNKRQSVEDIRTAIREIRRRRIHVHGMFVFGFEADTPATARATVDFALKEKIDSAQFLILTPLPGSSFYTQMLAEGRILDTKWDTYDCHHVKFVPHGFTPWELQQEQIRAHRRFYSLRHVLARLLRGRVGGFVIGVYAHSLNRVWQRAERPYLRILRRLLPAPARRPVPVGGLGATV
jgi:radical SAM superfamily enzyme YgiQ (UPF0313 family)